MGRGTAQGQAWRHRTSAPRTPCPAYPRPQTPTPPQPVRRQRRSDGRGGLRGGGRGGQRHRRHPRGSAAPRGEGVLVCWGPGLVASGTGGGRECRRVPAPLAASRPAPSRRRHSFLPSDQWHHRGRAARRARHAHPQGKEGFSASPPPPPLSQRPTTPAAKPVEPAHPPELPTLPPLPQRMMFDEADAFIALPGGYGTLEELVEMAGFRFGWVGGGVSDSSDSPFGSGSGSSRWAGTMG